MIQPLLLWPEIEGKNVKTDMGEANRKRKGEQIDETGKEKTHSGPLCCTPTSSGQLNDSAPVNTLSKCGCLIRLPGSSP